ncbi:Putative flavin-containing monoamine oxidase A [Fusarium odoratissimum]|uniref:Amine oxidase n=1 Tax=Fusarium oxysporum f. sp. cubense (strain race 4) TaxID=2502994 RepID=N1S9U5_FUSC4|nr:Putative flavin-containing monoamine oxidase A [Fusarium odoratissimum]
MAVSTSSSSTQWTHEPVDVAIVGGGLSGLAAAKDLVAAGKSVLVLEARDRVGGKVYDVEVKDGNGHKVEAGAECVCKNHKRLLALASELGIKTFPTYIKGYMLMWIPGQGRLLYDPVKTQGMPSLSEEDIKTMTDITVQVNEMATRGVIDMTNRAILSADGEDVSLLSVVINVARTGDRMEMLTNVKNGFLEERIEGGPQNIAIKLAECIGSDTVRLRASVRQILQSDAGYLVVGDSFRVQAQKVIIAIPPILAGRIVYQPPLPAARDQLCQRVPMGSIGKVIAIYKTPFWRDQDLSGEVASLEGVSQSTFDSSPLDGSFGAMLGFIEANEMRRLDDASEEEIFAVVKEDFARYFGPKAREVQSWVLQRWDNEEFSRGGHTGLFPPNVWTQFGPALTKPARGIYFAGTEASSY